MISESTLSPSISFPLLYVNNSVAGDREQSFALMVSSARPSLFMLRVCIQVAAAMAELVYVEL